MEIEKLEIEIQKDLSKFKEDVAGGLSLRQLLHVLAGGIVSVIMYIVLSLCGLNFLGSVITILIATPIFVSGFFEYQGLTFREFLQIVIEFVTTNKVATYEDYTIEELEELESEFYKKQEK